MGRVGGGLTGCEGCSLFYTLHGHPHLLSAVIVAWQLRHPPAACPPRSRPVSSSLLQAILGIAHSTQRRSSSPSFLFFLLPSSFPTHPQTQCDRALLLATALLGCPRRSTTPCARTSSDRRLPARDVPDRRTTRPLRLRHPDISGFFDHGPSSTSGLSPLLFARASPPAAGAVALDSRASRPSVAIDASPSSSLSSRPLIASSRPCPGRRPPPVARPARPAGRTASETRGRCHRSQARTPRCGHRSPRITRFELH